MTERFQADASEMRKRQLLVDRVQAHLSRNEQETSIEFFGDSNRFLITTYKPAIVRKVLGHDYAAIRWLYVHRPDAPNLRVDSVDEYDEVPGRPGIEGVCALMPLGALSIKGSPRQSDKPSKVAHTPRDAAQVREVFDDE